ncbi:GNAT family N-acetyltransferase [Nocardioides jiangxiensis]|uniref:GNAT family N-acetyltransferase n=1 Tax=Nocardioides jiangxiensis TaxID=3064524 RepID=A0ABT9B1I3_9ACTN|nr:GNAT family N-acetyltransferase [Nocardioides sp. WY-20]MDO7868715.1 GNAT family N-acetyltransferase [Nocardioides sp. WY-20]
MNDLRIIRLDPSAASFDADVARWHEVHVASSLPERPDSSPWRIAEVRDYVGTPVPFRWCVGWLALCGDDAVGAALLEAPLVTNLEVANVFVDVLPSARRGGVGTALLDVVEGEARRRGRTIAMAEVSFGLELPEDGAGSPDVHFARTRGYDVALGDVQRRLELPVDPVLLDRLAAEAAPHHAAYRIEVVRGALPDTLAPGYAALASTLAVEAPAGDLLLEAEDPSTQGWRDREAAYARQGLTLWHALALSPAGEVVAHSTIAVSAHDPSLCHQWGTLVRADHRGHRLGLAVKVALHRALQADGAPAPQVATWNATVNDHMVAINDRLGFHKVGRSVELQKRL